MSENSVLAMVNKQLKHTAWHGMGQLDLYPISRIPGALRIVKDLSCQPALK